MTRTSIFGLLLLALAVSACETGEARVVDRPEITADADDDAPRLRRVWRNAGSYASPRDSVRGRSSYPPEVGAWGLVV